MVFDVRNYSFIANVNGKTVYRGDDGLFYITEGNLIISIGFKTMGDAITRC